jgi:hypothetical protein
MNPTSQLDLHPEAESLNAFVEQALPPPERAQILAHLAACSRCRQVVYLAQEAAAAEQPAPVRAVPSTAPSAPWFRSWSFAWAPAAAALAAVVALAVFGHVRRAPAGPELARLAPQSEPALPAPATAPAATPAATPAAAKRAAPPAVALEEREAAAAPALSGASMYANAGSLPPPSAAYAPRPGIFAQRAAVEPRPAPAESALRQPPAEGAPAPSIAALPAAQPLMKSVVHRTEAAQRAALVAAPKFAEPPAPSAGFDTGASPAPSGLAAPGFAASVQLPGGLGAVSFATARQRALALDKSGALFLSQDAGNNWEPIARQWTGRAVLVRAVQDFSGSAPPSASVFELVNENGLIWVSPDGRSWTAK